MSVIHVPRWALAFMAAAGPVVGRDRVPPPPPGIARANFDTSRASCTAFYRYVNGARLDRTAIPAQFSSYGIGRQMRDRTEALLRLARRAAISQQEGLWR